MEKLPELVFFSLVICSALGDITCMAINNTQTGNTKMKKATKATLKSFVKKNREALLVKVESRFSGMTDMVETVEDTFDPAEPVGMGTNFEGEEFDRTTDYNLGICGIHLVAGSRNSITCFETDELVGLNVYNCCGEFTVAIKK